MEINKGRARAIFSGQEVIHGEGCGTKKIPLATTVGKEAVIHGKVCTDHCLLAWADVQTPTSTILSHLILVVAYNRYGREDRFATLVDQACGQILLVYGLDDKNTSTGFVSGLYLW